MERLGYTPVEGSVGSMSSLLVSILITSVLIVLVLIASGCHLNEDFNESEKSEQASPSTIEAPVINLDPAGNMFNIQFSQGINPNSGDVLLDDGTNIHSVYHNGEFITNKGFQGNYKNEGSYTIITIKGDSSQGINYYDYQRVIVKNFISPSGNPYSPAAESVQSSVLTNTLSAKYDPDTGVITVSLPAKIIDSSSMKMFIYYGPDPETKREVVPVISPDKKSLTVGVKLTDYPKIILQSVVMENNNQITYKVIDVDRLPSPTLSEMNINGFLNVSVYDVTPGKQLVSKVYTASSPIWSFGLLKSMGYINDIGGMTMIVPRYKTMFQKWANWDIHLVMKNVKNVEIYDGAGKMDLVFTTNVAFMGDVINIRWDVVNNGLDISEPGLKLENAVFRLYEGVGTNYLETNFSSIVDLSSNQNLFLDFAGIEMPRIVVDGVSVSGYDIVNYLYDGIITFPDISQAGGGSLVKNINSDKMRIWDKIISYGGSFQETNILTKNVWSESPLVSDIYSIIDPEYYFYDKAGVEAGKAYLEEDAHLYTNFTVLDAERGIVSIEKRTTVEFLDDFTYSRKAQVENKLFRDYYHAWSYKNITPVDDFTINIAYNMLSYFNYDESTSSSWPRYRGAPNPQYLRTVASGYLDSSKVFMKMSKSMRTVGDSFKQTRSGTDWYYNRWVTFNANYCYYPKRSNLDYINQYNYTGSSGGLDHHNLYESHFRYEGSVLKKFEETQIASQ